MDYLLRLKIAPKSPLHHKAMLSDVAVAICGWMVWTTHEHIALPHCRSTTFPPRILLTSRRSCQQNP
jgi:hypothetical protein